MQLADTCVQLQDLVALLSSQVLLQERVTQVPWLMSYTVYRQRNKNKRRTKTGFNSPVATQTYSK